MTGGSGYDEAIVTELKRELGVSLQPETMGDGYFDRLATDPPAMWSLAWVADYPGRNDFLGVLLGSNASNNYGHWSSPEFDAAIAEAVAATDPAVASAAYDRAEAIVRDDVPVVPRRYGPGWALTRDGLLGAGQNGLGIVRHGGSGVGGLTHLPVACCRVFAVARRSLLGLRAGRCRRRARTSGRRRATSTFGTGIDLQPTGHVSTSRSAAWSSC